MAEGRRDQRGGIFALLDLIEEHRAAFEYDWRARFNRPLSDVPEAMPWGEAIRLTGLLRRDPSSWVAASLEGWEFPISREAVYLLDLFDLEHAKASKKAKPHEGRPWKRKGETRRRGSAAGRTPAEVKAILRSQFGQPEQPPV